MSKMKLEAPSVILEKIAAANNLNTESVEFANCLDEQDELREYRKEFVFPKLGSIPKETFGDPEQDCLYLLGNSLGLKPKTADRYMQEQLTSWGEKGIYMHTSGRVPACYADQPCKAMIARIVGARLYSEVTIMNGLTVNLHLFMLAFYKPIGNRNKIIIEDHAFPSDRYAVVSLMRVLNVDPERLILLRPRSGEHCLRTEDIIATIHKEKDEVALVMLPGVQYYTGQKLDMEKITRFCVDSSVPIGWDLAHAVGNIQLQLHNWGADFAVWCSYKYLNSGAGGISGAFLHERHHANPPAHLQGWWSNKQENRFEMKQDCEPSSGAESFRLCNPPPWLAALHLASLEIFDKVGMRKLTSKQHLLTGYLEYLLKKKLKDEVEITTPSDPEQRGCQLSLLFKADVTAVHSMLESKGIICDLRKNVMRIAPVPLYNSFYDVWKFVETLKEDMDDPVKEVLTHDFHL